MNRVVIMIVSLAVLGACQTTETSEGSTEIETTNTAQQKSPATGAISTLPQSGLGPQDLAPGECGLFLWSQTDVSKFIFFSRALSGEAQLAQGYDPVTLTQTNAGGGIFGQFTTEMMYGSETGNTYALSITPGDELEGGQRLENGLITITDLEGWVTKLPVLGVRACQPQE
jgi:hypothetical protein